MSAQIEPVYEDDDVLDFGALFRQMLARRWWIIAAVVVSTGVFTAAAFLITPVYRANVLLMPAGNEHGSASGGSLTSALGQLGGLASLAGVNVGGVDTVTDEAIAVLHSREFTTRFINEKNLLPVLFAKQWDASTKTWKGPGGGPTQAQAYEYFDGEIRSVKQDKKTPLVTVQVDWRDRTLAAEWANDLVARLNAEMRARAIAKAAGSLGFLEKELATTSVIEVRDAVNRLIETQVKQRMLANVTQEYVFRVIDRAVVPDEDAPVRPNKSLLLALGPIVGFIVGAMAALLIPSAKPQGAGRRGDRNAQRG